MAKVKPSIIEESGTIGNRVFYNRFGKTFSRSHSAHINDKKSEAQLRQRALFKAMQHTSSLLGSAIQRGLAKIAHKNGHVENNEFAKINKDCFTYDGGTVYIDYPRLLLSTGLIGYVEFLHDSITEQQKAPTDSLHLELHFNQCLYLPHARPDDIVHIYAVEFQAEVCELVASVQRQSGVATFDLPDLSDDPDCKGTPTFHLYAIVEAANTALIPTLSPYEKRIDKNHRNINRHVSPSIYIGKVSIQ